MMSKPISKKLLGLISVAMLVGVITGDAFAQQNSQTGPPAKSGSDFDRHSEVSITAELPAEGDNPNGRPRFTLASFGLTTAIPVVTTTLSGLVQCAMRWRS